MEERDFREERETGPAKNLKELSLEQKVETVRRSWSEKLVAVAVGSEEMSRERERREG